MATCKKVVFDTPALKYTGKLAGLYEGDLPEPRSVYTQLINDILTNNTENSIHKDLLTRFVYSLYVKDLGDPFPFNDICRLLYFKLHNIEVENEGCVYVTATVDDEEIKVSLRNDLERVWAKVLFDIWQKTAEIITWPYDFIADGKPLYDWTIEGNLTQTGTPSPATIIFPSECGDRTENLWTDSNEWTNASTDTRSFFQLHIALYSGSTGLGYVRKDIKADGQNFLVSVTPNTDFDRVYVKHNGSTRDLQIANIYGNFKANIPVTLSFNVNGHDPTIIGGINISNVMLNEGSTALPHVPYGYEVTPKINNASYPIYLSEPIRKIADYSDVLSSEGKVMRRIKKLVLTGQETRWNKSGLYQGSFYLSNVLPAPISLTEQAYCSHAEFTSISTYARNKFCFNGSPINLNLWIGESSWTTDDFKSYLAQQYSAGTPVTVWYVLAEPIEESVEVPTLDTIPGDNTIDVDTTLKPSKMTITYS